MKGCIKTKDMKNAVNLYHQIKHETDLKINIFFYNSYLGNFF